jgi:hypothetical protein
MISPLRVLWIKSRLLSSGRLHFFLLLVFVSPLRKPTFSGPLPQSLLLPHSLLFPPPPRSLLFGVLSLFLVQSLVWTVVPFAPFYRLRLITIKSFLMPFAVLVFLLSMLFCFFVFQLILA